MLSIPFPADSIIWATAATEGATTWPHIDDYGMATFVQVMTGRKLWVVMRPKDGQNTKDAWAGHLAERSPVVDHFDCEGVLLQPGDFL